jgi:tetratricopeptide (TPR) repeat protein
VVAAPAEAEVSRELPKGTIEALERAASLDPKFVAPHYWLGWIALSEKDPARAQLAFGRALALNPQHVRSVVGMADAQLREAKLVDAETRVTRAIEDLAATMTQSERCETYLLAASIAVARMQPPLAIENLLSALQADPRNRRATRELGEQFFRAGEFDRALEHFKQNAALSAGDPESTLGLIKAQFGKKDWAALLKVLPPAIAQYPRDGRFLYWFGRVQEEAVRQGPRSVRDGDSGRSQLPPPLHPARGARLPLQRSSLGAQAARRGTERRQHLVGVGQRGWRDLPRDGRDKPSGCCLPCSARHRSQQPRCPHQPGRSLHRYAPVQ